MTLRTDVHMKPFAGWLFAIGISLPFWAIILYPFFI